MIRQRPKYFESDVRMKDWHINEDLLGDGRYMLSVSCILQVYSTENFEECRKVLRAVVNTWINLKLARDGIDHRNKELWKRERNLLINYYPLADFQWGFRLQEAANAYNQFEGRQPHKAMLVIQGNTWKFETSLKKDSF